MIRLQAFRERQWDRLFDGERVEGGRFVVASALARERVANLFADLFRILRGLRPEEDEEVAPVEMLPDGRAPLFAVFDVPTVEEILDALCLPTPHHPTQSE